MRKIEHQCEDVRSQYTSFNQDKIHKASTKTKPTRNCNIKCFKCQGKGHMASECPNRKTMVMRDDSEIVINDEQDIHPTQPLEDNNNADVQ